MNRINTAIINLCTRCLAAFAFVSLSSCSNEDSDSSMASLRVSAFAYERPSVTRAVTPGYEDFASVYSVSQETPLAMNYWICLGNSFQVEQTATYNGTTWNPSCNLEINATPYHFYSYMPGGITSKDITASLNSSVSPAVMTFTGIPAIVEDDIIISEAVTSGENATDDPFDQLITSAANQAVTFRMQHILAKVSFSFSNPAEKSFSDMRKIVVKRLELYPETSGSKHDVACTMGQTITYAWTPTPGPTDDYFINDNTEFTINGKKAYGYLVEQNASKAYCSCYMVPFNNNKIKIRVIYDVYTHDGSLIRDNEISVNNNLTISNTSTVAAGMEYKINVKIIPDYLYMLSDVDAGTSLEIKTN